MRKLYFTAAMVLLGTALRVPAAPASLLSSEPAAGSVLYRARIPSDANVQGETRLINRDDGACVQTLLHTTALRRAIHEMLKQERSAWPEGAPGYSDSMAYRAAMESAKQHVLASAGTNAVAEGPLSLLMEMSQTPTTSGYAFYDVQLTREAGEFLVSDKRLIASAPASRDYVSRAMRLMTAAAFHMQETELTNLLCQAGWQPSAAVDDGHRKIAAQVGP